MTLCRVCGEVIPAAFRTVNGSKGFLCWNPAEKRRVHFVMPGEISSSEFELRGLQQQPAVEVDSVKEEV